jgi:hypothetical protein
MLAVAALMAFAVFQALIGCNGCFCKPAPNKGTAIHLERTPANKWMTHHRIASGDVITWKATDSFFVVFKAGQNPCGKDTFGAPTPDVNVYNSKLVGNNHYEAQCTVNNTKVPKPWEYEVGDGNYTPPPPGKDYVPFPVIPCDGCRVGEDPYAE